MSSEIRIDPVAGEERSPVYRQATDLAVAVDAQLLDMAPESERSRFVGLGVSVLAVTAVNFAAGTYALWLVLHPTSAQSTWLVAWNGLICHLVGGVWALVILNLFRFGLSIAHESTAPPVLDRSWVMHLVWRAVGVAAFAGLIGSCVALPVTIWVVRSDISGSLTAGQRAVLASLHEQVDARFESELSRLYVEQVADAMEEERLRDRVRSARKASNAMSTSRRGERPAVDSANPAASNAAEAGAAAEILVDRIARRTEKIREIREQTRVEKSLETRRLERRDSLFTEAHRALEHGAGLYWAIAFFMSIIHAGPLLVRIFSPRGPYEHFVELQSEVTLAGEGIMVRANSLRDEDGTVHQADRYLKAEAIREETIGKVFHLQEKGLAIIRKKSNERLGTLAKGSAHSGQ